MTLVGICLEFVLVAPVLEIEVLVNNIVLLCDHEGYIELVDIEVEGFLSSLKIQREARHPVVAPSKLYSVGVWVRGLLVQCIIELCPSI